MKNLVKISILAAGLFAFASCNNEAKQEETATTTDTATVVTEQEVTPTAPDTASTTQPADTAATSTEHAAH